MISLLFFILFDGYGYKVPADVRADAFLGAVLLFGVGRRLVDVFVAGN